jgi:hypothetical protein
LIIFNKTKELYFIKNYFEKEDWKMISTEYKGKCNVICPNGHKINKTYSNFKQGCVFCSKTKKLEFDFIKETFEKKGWKLISNYYKNVKQKLNVICPNGHKIFKTFTEFKYYGCDKCDCENKSNLLKKK